MPRGTHEPPSLRWEASLLPNAPVYSLGPHAGSLLRASQHLSGHSACYPLFRLHTSLPASCPSRLSPPPLAAPPTGRSSDLLPLLPRAVPPTCCSVPTPLHLLSFHPLAAPLSCRSTSSSPPALTTLPPPGSTHSLLRSTPPPHCSPPIHRPPWLRSPNALPSPFPRPLPRPSHSPLNPLLLLPLAAPLFAVSPPCCSAPLVFRSRDAPPTTVPPTCWSAPVPICPLAAPPTRRL